MALLTVGTTVTRLLNPNKLRASLSIQMQAQSVDSANTGKVFVGFGFQPVATVGHPSQGEILIQASGIFEPSDNFPLREKYKKQVWAIADTANQSLIVEEAINDEPEAPPKAAPAA